MTSGTIFGIEPSGSGIVGTPSTPKI